MLLIARKMITSTVCNQMTIVSTLSPTFSNPLLVDPQAAALLWSTSQNSRIKMMLASSIFCLAPARLPNPSLIIRLTLSTLCLLLISLIMMTILWIPRMQHFYGPT